MQNLRTRREYIHVGSEAASLRLMVLRLYAQRLSLTLAWPEGLHSACLLHWCELLDSTDRESLGPTLFDMTLRRGRDAASSPHGWVYGES